MKLGAKDVPTSGINKSFIACWNSNGISFFHAFCHISLLLGLQLEILQEGRFIRLVDKNLISRNAKLSLFNDPLLLSLQKFAIHFSKNFPVKMSSDLEKTTLIIFWKDLTENDVFLAF